MARRKNRIVTVIVTVLVILLLIGIVAACSWATNGFNDAPKIFGVTINGKYYPNNADGLVLDKQTTVSVTTDNYDVYISSVTVKEDFVFLIGEEEYKWSDVRTADLAKGFGLSIDGKTFTLTYDDLAGVLADSLGYDVNDIYVPDVPTKEDLFALRVVSDGSEIRLGFTLSDLSGNANVENITLDKTEIVF